MLFWILLILAPFLHPLCVNATGKTDNGTLKSTSRIYVDAHSDTIFLSDTTFVFKTSPSIRIPDISATLLDKTLAVCTINDIRDGFMQISSVDYANAAFNDLEIKCDYTRDFNPDSELIEFRIPNYYPSGYEFDCDPPSVYQLDIDITSGYYYPQTIEYNYDTSEKIVGLMMPRRAEYFIFSIRPHDITSRMINRKYEGIAYYLLPPDKYESVRKIEFQYATKITITLPNFKYNYIDMLYFKNYCVPFDGNSILFLNKKFHLVQSEGVS